MSLTGTQQQAITARGNVLLVAGAGTGKTRTLVERCIDCLLREAPPLSLEEILMVTFTEAAASEMRHRIRTRLEQEVERAPENPRWREQVALFETAQIGTLHSFCFKLIREHFYELELDPQLAIMPEEEAWLLAEDTLDELLQEQYAAESPMADATRALVAGYGKGSDHSIRELILAVHRYSQSLPDAAGWLRAQRAMLETAEPERWREWLADAVNEFKSRWLALLTSVTEPNAVTEACVRALRNLPLIGEAPPDAIYAALGEICLSQNSCPHGKKTEWVKPLAPLFADAEFLESLFPAEDRTDPLAQDWSWVRGHMAALLNLAEAFTGRFAAAKRELGMLDFADLEQYALTLLWDPKNRVPTPIARRRREKLRFVFVDEYQDINAAQDKIIECISRDGAASNRFLVGDVKQSIYRFRLADPAIFQRYVETWRDDSGRALPLRDNFRSRPGILDFVNSLFAGLMRPDLGGIAYGEDARLLAGAASAFAPDDSPAVELRLRVKSSDQEPATHDADSPGEVADLAEADREARLIAQRLLELKREGFLVRDDDAGGSRPVDWKDMAILLRAPSGKAESYAKEFSRAGIPLVVERSGFYQALEISDLVSLLHLFDNPLQDIQTLAVLRSPLVGLAADELAVIRLACKGHFWTALLRWHQAQRAIREREPALPPANDPLAAAAARAFSKVETFLSRFERWRTLARHASLCRCLETVLAETRYHAWVLTQSRGAQRHANVTRLLGLAQQFDRFQRQGLFRFLRFIEAQEKAGSEPPVPVAAAENAVRLMSVHRSKGLEFPVVVVADLGKLFNQQDLRSEILLDAQFGLCPHVKPPGHGSSYPSLACWLASKRQGRELLGEEMRLLYVAATRAKDKLLLTGSISQTKLDRCLEAGGEPRAVERARSYIEWLVTWLGTQPGFNPDIETGRTDLIHWFTLNDSHLAQPPTESQEPELAPGLANTDTWLKVQAALAGKYPHVAAISRPAKTSVTRLRIQAALAELEEPPRSPTFRHRSKMRSHSASDPQQPVAPSRKKQASAPARLPAAAVGAAHHTFLQWMNVAQAEDASSLRQESDRLVSEGVLSPEEAAVLDLEAIAEFWKSRLGQDLRQQQDCLRRELPFTFRVPADLLAALLGEASEPGLEKEFVVVQGVADLVCVLPNELWIVDFKTDSVQPRDLSEKTRLYAPQLKLYAMALSAIYSRPTTRCSLYFLSCGRQVDVAVGNTLPAKPRRKKAAVENTMELGL